MVDRIERQGVDTAKKWKEKWEFAKQFIPEKLSLPEIQQKWYQNATSDTAEQEWFNEVKNAYEKKKRKKNLEKVDPSDWADRTIAGLAAKTITNQEMIDYLKGDPIRTLVQQARDIIKQVPDSITRGHIWMDFMKQLKGLTQDEIAQKHNELLNWLRTEVERRVGIKVTLRV